MHCVACVDERTMGPVSLVGYSPYGERVGQPLLCYRLERGFPHADVVGETLPRAFPICGDS